MLVSEIAKHSLYSELNPKSMYHQVLCKADPSMAFEAGGKLCNFKRMLFVINEMAGFQR